MGEKTKDGIQATSETEKVRAIVKIVLMSQLGKIVNKRIDKIN